MPASDDLTDAEAATVELLAKIKGRLERSRFVGLIMFRH